MVDRKIRVSNGLTEKEFIFWEDKNGLKKSVKLEVQASRIIGLQKITTSRSKFVLDNYFYKVGVLFFSGIQIYEVQNVKILF